MVKAIKAYFIRFEVTGRGAFPMDMLRYDQCWPYRSEDADMLAAEQPRTVTLIRATTNGSSGPTFGRWSSFGWSVDPTSLKEW